MKKVLILTQYTYMVAKNDTSGFYSPESTKTFEDYVNFELSVLEDGENKDAQIHPLIENNYLMIVVTYKSKN